MVNLTTTTNGTGEHRHQLDSIFKPRAVAVIGATERAGSVGRTILWNLISSPFGGTVYPVNPKRNSILGIRAYPDIASIPEQLDLAVIVTPAPTVPDVIQECVDAGVTGVIIISAGFKERGPRGAELERRIMEIAKGKMRIIGPNCLGVMHPIGGMNATFASRIANGGNVGFISQSGALCTSVLDWSFRENVGFSAFISVGSMLDVGWGDLIYYLGDDPETQSIVIYMESVGDAPSFLSAAREVALRKPIIIIKAGRTAAAAQAAASHTGALTGSDEVLDAAFKRVGILRVDRISDVFNMSEVLAKQPRPKGKRLAIITNAGGPGVLATDSLITSGGELAPLSDETMEQLNHILPKHWSHGNPVDILGDAPPELYAQTLEIVATDPNNDGLLVIVTPQAMTDPSETARKLEPYRQIEGKPVLASWMGGEEIADGEEILNLLNIPTFGYPDTAARMFNYMWQYAENLRSLYETPSLPTEGDDPNRALVKQIVDHARAHDRTILTEYESKQVLAAYFIPTVQTVLADTAEAAVEAAGHIGYPVVLKLNSETITHKTDVGGVILNLADAEAVRGAFARIQTAVASKAGAEHFQGVTVQPMLKLDGYELIIGSSIDSQFGPVLLFGTGGSLVEVFKDRALALPPLNTTLARRMMEQTKIYEALHGVRGRDPVDLAALESLMVRFSQLVVEQPWIKEIDINPLLASPERLIALDARVVLHTADTPEDQLPRPAIRPYPVQYVKPFTMHNGETVTLRPIRPEDEPLLVTFHSTLSERTVYLRYLKTITYDERIAHDRLSRMTFIDYNREMALVAEHKDAQTGAMQIIAAGRLSRVHTANDAEFAIVVSDHFQGQGLGRAMLRELLAIGKAEQVQRITGSVMADNIDMLRLAEDLGFSSHRVEGEPIVKVDIDLQAQA
jgi:acetyltransferase